VFCRASVFSASQHRAMPDEPASGEQEAPPTTLAQREVKGKVIVIDNGSRFFRAGFSGEQQPTTVFPSIVSKSKPVKQGEDADPYISEDSESEHQGPIVGDEAHQRRHKDVFTSPLVDGLVVNWDDLETIWRYTFTDKLKVNVQEHAVMLMEPLLNPKSVRSHMTQLLFETFDAPAVFIGSQAEMALFSSGNTTGVVLDSGAGHSKAVPVYCLHPIPHAVQSYPLAGRQLTLHLLSMLMDRGLTFEMHHNKPRNVTKVTGAKLRKQNDVAVTLARDKDVGSKPSRFSTRQDVPGNEGADARPTLASQKSLRSMKSVKSQGTRSLESTKARSKAELEKNGAVMTFSRKGTSLGQGSARKEGLEEGEERKIPEAIASIIRGIKEKAAYVALDFEAEVRKARQTSDVEMTCELFGQETVILNEERFRCGEALFEPYVLKKDGINTKGLQHAIVDAVMTCDAEVQKELLKSVVLCGGTMMTPGVVERMDKELRVLLPANRTVNVIRGESCIHSAWIGGAKFATQEGFLGGCIPRAQFDEEGPTLAERKFM